MKNLHKLSIILIILVMVFVLFVLSGGGIVALAIQNQPGKNRYSASVAWLEMCSVFDNDLMPSANPVKEHIPV